MIMLSIAWYVYNYMPLFGKQARLESSGLQAESMEMHENVGNYIIASVVIMWILAWRMARFKKDKVTFLTIAFILGIGYMSNYIGYTTLATMFYFWDGDTCTEIFINKRKRSHNLKKRNIESAIQYS